MVATINQRIAANIEGDFVVFLIGARINRWWKLNKFFAIGNAMSRMVEELKANPELGMLHGRLGTSVWQTKYGERQAWAK